MSYTQLTQGQRYQIYAMYIIGYNQMVMAKVIVSQKTTISWELQRFCSRRGYRPRRDHFLG
jgi:IS30 family transposase